MYTMSNKGWRAAVSVALAFLIAAACSESPNTTQPELRVAAAATPPDCRVGNLKKDARDYFGQTESASIQDLMDIYQDECDGGDADLAVEAMFDALSLTTIKIGDGLGGDPGDGASLVAGMMGKMSTGSAQFDCLGVPNCTIPSLNSLEDAITDGMIGVRGAGASSFPAHGHVVDPTVPLTNGDWGIYSADWNALLPLAWNGSPDGNRALFWGWPGVNLFNFETAPEFEQFADGNNLVVGTCLDVSELDPGIRRGQVVLSFVDAAVICNEPVPPGFALGPGVLRRLFAFAAGAIDPRPQSLNAALLKSVNAALLTSPGGLGRHTSPFSLVSVGFSGQLEVLNPPPPRRAEVDEGFTVKVRATTETGDPIELVEVRLSVSSNNANNLLLSVDGQPASAVTAFTDEDDGIATFHNVSVNKTGGATICATAVGSSTSVAGYTFADDCANTQVNIVPPKN